MRIHGVTVCRNEANRYLESSLAWNSKFLDDIHVYDDASTDDSAHIADGYATVVERPDGVPTLLENEAAFRRAAYESFVETMEPEEGDWVLAFDLDEFAYGIFLDTVIDLWTPGVTGGIVHRPEVWDWDEKLIRTDGFWGEIDNLRLWQYQDSEPLFRDQPLAGGSHPLSAELKTEPIEEFFLLHLGYSTPEDRKERYERYRIRGGHNPKHIDSIVNAQPILQPLEAEYGPLPQVWRRTQ